jgi:hypothetical protein
MKRTPGLPGPFCHPDGAIIAGWESLRDLYFCFVGNVIAKEGRWGGVWVKGARGTGGGRDGSEG